MREAKPRSMRKRCVNFIQSALDDCSRREARLKTLPTDENQSDKVLCEKCASVFEMLEAGVEPARVIHPGDFKSPVSTIPPPEQKRAQQ